MVNHAEAAIFYRPRLTECACLKVVVDVCGKVLIRSNALVAFSGCEHGYCRFPACAYISVFALHYCLVLLPAQGLVVNPFV